MKKQKCTEVNLTHHKEMKEKLHVTQK